jgi:hypothetical protein
MDWVRWLTPIILAMGEEKIWRLALASPGKCSRDPHLNQWLCVVAQDWPPNSKGNINMRITFQAGMDRNARPYLKNT